MRRKRFRLLLKRGDGLAAIKEIKRQSPETRILTLTIHDSDDYILECFKAGVAGYCLKDSSQDELLKAVYVVLSGKTYIRPGITDKVMQGYLEGKKTLKPKTSWDMLTQPWTAEPIPYPEFVPRLYHLCIRLEFREGLIPG